MGYDKQSLDRVVRTIPIKKANKYGARKTIVDGITFDSKKESNRYVELKLLEKQHLISELNTQTKFNLIPKQDGERAVNYYADFTYIDNGVLIVEDVKSAATRKRQDYIIKRKLMLYVHNIKIKEI